MRGQVSGKQAPDVCAVRGGGGSTDPATLVGDVNHQEVNNLPAEAWGGLLASITYRMLRVGCREAIPKGVCRAVEAAL